MSKTRQAKIIDFCAAQAKAERKSYGLDRYTVRDLVAVTEQELAAGSHFYLIAPEGGMTELFDPIAIALAIIKTSARSECGAVGIVPVPERRHIFYETEGWQEL